MAWVLTECVLSPQQGVQHAHQPKGLQCAHSSCHCWCCLDQGSWHQAQQLGRRRRLQWLSWGRCTKLSGVNL